MSQVALLDVNVLVALFTPDHIHHDAAHDWFAEHRASGWATCSITENGLVRVLAHPSLGAGLRTTEIADRMRRFRESGDHHFWNDRHPVSDASLFNLDFVSSPRQVTDVHLLGIAVTNGGVLATFDDAIPWRAVEGATRDHLQVIGLAEGETTGAPDDR